MQPLVGDSLAPAVHVVGVGRHDVAQSRWAPQTAPKARERGDPLPLAGLLDDAPEVDERVVVAGVVGAVAPHVARGRQRPPEAAPAGPPAGGPAPPRPPPRGSPAPPAL